MIRELRGDMTSLKPANEALMFAIYYSAIISMEEDEVSAPWIWKSRLTDLSEAY
jgi:hypothetical protein